jgi:predicted nucleic acid-binding Zn finger protein
MGAIQDKVPMGQKSAFRYFVLVNKANDYVVECRRYSICIPCFGIELAIRMTHVSFFVAI